jgi:hypothetical protein
MSSGAPIFIWCPADAGIVWETGNNRNDKGRNEHATPGGRAVVDPGRADGLAMLVAQNDGRTEA